MQELDTKLGNTINFGKASATLAPTDKQIKTLKGLIYTYRINVKDTPEMGTRQGISRKITEIYKAIEKGQVQKRSELPKNCKVMRINSVWKVVQISSFETNDAKPLF